MRPLRRFLQDTGGAAAVEFALLAPLLLLLLAGLINIGFEVDRRFRLESALREGAEAALYIKTVDELEPAITKVIKGALNDSGISFKDATEGVAVCTCSGSSPLEEIGCSRIEPRGCAGVFDNEVVVRMQVKYNHVPPLPLAFLENIFGKSSIFSPSVLVSKSEVQKK